MRVKSIGSNKTEIIFSDSRILVSYETPVCFISGKIAVKTDEFFSVTTSKHINQWLSENGFNPKTVETNKQEYFDQLLEDMN